MSVRVAGCGGVARIRFRVLRTWRERLVGLLGARRGGASSPPVLLERCGSVHTFGMRVRIDVALVDGRGRVLLSRRGVPSGRLLSARGAIAALERLSSPFPWPLEGERLAIPNLLRGP